MMVVGDVLLDGDADLMVMVAVIVVIGTLLGPSWHAINQKTSKCPLSSEDG